MNIHIRKPIPSLAIYIDRLWLCEGYQPGHRLEYKLPDASLAWIVNLKEDRIRVFDNHRLDRPLTLPGSIIAGPQSSYYYLDTASQESCLGIQFKPGGAFPFLGQLVGQLRDVDMALKDGLGRHSHADELRDRLLELDGAEQRFQCVERYLLRLLEKKVTIPRGHPAVAYALHMFMSCPEAPPAIADLADQANLSTERFIRVFKEEVGVTPKTYAGIVRFQRALRKIREDNVYPSIDMALSCGYYDQSHLYREFRKYANMTPTELYYRQDILANHVPL